MPTTPNTIRVFISSTFRDMEAEREELIKYIFPQLRKLCQERGVGFVGVDLRWGVTEEQSERGEALPICLAEIDRCRPYFIGLLGERYGWVPPAGAIPQELIDDQPWLVEHREKSLTDLEIVHGVLRNPAMADRAFFYFRDPAYLDQIPPERCADFMEADSAARDKLAALKTDIRESGVTWKSYPDPQALGQAVLSDLTVEIDRRFPPDQAPDALRREAMEHEAFAQSRTGVYIGRPEYFARLDKHAGSSEEGPGVVLLGESGSGKSALLANWATRFREQHPDDLVVMHFIGADQSGTIAVGGAEPPTGSLAARGRKLSPRHRTRSSCPGRENQADSPFHTSRSRRLTTLPCPLAGALQVTQALRHRGYPHVEHRVG